MLIFLIVALSVFVYSLMAGVAFKSIAHYYRRAEETKVFGAIFWPVAIPIGLGILLMDRIGTSEDRTNSKRQREIEAARHQTALLVEQKKQNDLLDGMLK